MRTIPLTGGGGDCQNLAEPFLKTPYQNSLKQYASFFNTLFTTFEILLVIARKALAFRGKGNLKENLTRFCLVDCPACATLAMPQKATKALFAITPKKAFLSFCAFGLLAHNAFAVELSTICPSGSTDCHINATYQGQSVTNNQYVNLSTDIHLDTPLNSFINNSIIRLSNTSIRARTANQGSLENFINNGRIESTTDYTNTIIFEGGRALNNVINYGYIAGAIAVSDDWSLTITNHGTMGGVFNQSTNGTNITINNRGVINQTIGRYHFSGIVTIINYAMQMNSTLSQGTTPK